MIVDLYLIEKHLITFYNRHACHMVLNGVENSSSPIFMQDVTTLLIIIIKR